MIKWYGVEWGRQTVVAQQPGKLGKPGRRGLRDAIYTRIDLFGS